MDNLNEFKQASELIYQNRKAVKSQMDELSKNVYSTINQLNFSIKLIVDTNSFISKYINSEESILTKLTNAFAVEDTDTAIDLYDNVAFNSLFISAVSFFQNFSKILMESISYFLVSSDGTEDTTLKAIHESYCNAMSIKNDWLSFKATFNSFFNNYNAVFSIVDPRIADVGFVFSLSQITLWDQYIEYRSLFNTLSSIFNDGESISVYTLYESIPYIEYLIGYTKSVIDFKSESTFYDNYLTRLTNTLVDTGDLFIRILDYVRILNDHNVEYQPDFKLDNQYIQVITDVCNVGNDLLGALRLKYPNRDSYQALIVDGDFTTILNVIHNLYRREIITASKLIDIAAKDYKLIKSLETFITADKSFDNSILYDIMNNFDDEVKGEDTLKNQLRSYFDETGSDTQPFGTDSFTYKLFNLSILTNPLYDILNYYRLFIYPFANDPALIFDFLETLHIYSLSITNNNFNQAMSQLFEIKISNIDYININKSKINESLTTKYESLTDLNYFDIQPYVDIIRVTDLSTIIKDPLDQDSLITDLSALFNNLTTYNLIIFTLIENILYNNIDLTEIMSVLSIKTNIRTLLFKLLFQIAIDKLITTIDDNYITYTPTKPSIYDELIKNTSDFTEDLNYLQLLLSANNYYSGSGTIFNTNTITDWTATGIWDTTKTDLIIELFSLYKEV